MFASWRFVLWTTTTYHVHGKRLKEIMRYDSWYAVVCAYLEASWYISGLPESLPQCNEFSWRSDLRWPSTLA
jgi:hypothetical protein